MTLYGTHFSSWIPYDANTYDGLTVWAFTVSSAVSCFSFLRSSISWLQSTNSCSRTSMCSTLLWTSFCAYWIGYDIRAGEILGSVENVILCIHTILKTKTYWTKTPLGYLKSGRSVMHQNFAEDTSYTRFYATRIYFISTSLSNLFLGHLPAKHKMSCPRIKQVTWENRKFQYFANVETNYVRYVDWKHRIFIASVNPLWYMVFNIESYSYKDGNHKISTTTKGDFE